MRINGTQHGTKADNLPTMNSSLREFLEAVATLAGKSPASVLEDCLWEQLPLYFEKIKERRARVIEAAVQAGISPGL
jgi:hypothetical protein